MERFPFDFALAALPLRLLGVNPGSAAVEVGDGRLEVSFGPWHLTTPLSNVEATHVTGPYSPLKAYGVRVSLSDLGATFGTTTDQGLCIRFREPVAAVVPGGVVRHPSLTVTVEEPERLARSIAREASEPRPLLAAVSADDVPARPVLEPEEDRLARERATRSARKAARVRAEHRQAEQEEAERAARRRSAVAKRAAATRAENRARRSASSVTASVTSPVADAASSARTATKRAARTATASRGEGTRTATKTATKRTASKRTPAKRTPARSDA